MKYEGLSTPAGPRASVNEGNIAYSDINSKFMECLVLALEMEKDRPKGTQKFDMVALKKLNAELRAMADQMAARLRLLSRGPQ